MNFNHSHPSTWLKLQSTWNFNLNWSAQLRPRQAACFIELPPHVQVLRNGAWALYILCNIGPQEWCRPQGLSKWQWPGSVIEVLILQQNCGNDGLVSECCTRSLSKGKDHSKVRDCRLSERKGGELLNPDHMLPKLGPVTYTTFKGGHSTCWLGGAKPHSGEAATSLSREVSHIYVTSSRAKKMQPFLSKAGQGKHFTIRERVFLAF